MHWSEIEMTKMPEPVDKMYAFLQAGLVLYTADQLKQYGRDLLEEAAEVCEEKHWTWRMGDNSGPKECAEAIRAMKETI
jgi:hypothetical protein